MRRKKYRGYQTKKQTGQKFKELLLAMRQRGDLILPPERELCEILECSRETVRRVLETEEAAGTIIKKGQNRALSLESAGNKTSLGHFAFVSGGTNMIGNPAWNKLWLTLHEKAETAGITSELILLSSRTTPEEYPFLFRDIPDVIVISTIGKKAVDYLRTLPEKLLISVEANYENLVENIIAPDAYKTGWLAAEKLYEHGYRRPALIRYEFSKKESAPYIPFHRRYLGFMDGCAHYGMKYGPESEFSMRGREYQKYMDMGKIAAAINKGPFDSAFLYSDDYLPFYYEAFSECRRIPEKFGLITVNSQDIAVEYSPHVSSCSHCTFPMATTLVSYITKYFKSGNTNIGRIYLGPKYHEGKTLKQLETVMV